VFGVLFWFHSVAGHVMLGGLAVQLQLQHPDSGSVLDICMDTSVAQLYERICALDASSEH
jgi:hypothetical protein